MAGAGDATEAPTPRRLDQARRRGEVAFSADLASSGALLAAVATLIAEGPASAARLLAYLRTQLTAAPTGGDGGPALAAGLDVLVRVLAAPLAVAALTALAVGAAQTRGLLALGAVRVDLARLSPADGLKRVFGGQAVLQIGKGLLKGAIVSALVGLGVRPLLGSVSALAGAPAGRVAALLGALAGQLAARIALVAVALGVADYFLVRRRHLHRLRMSRDEVKRENKEAEGDPAHRAERARLHRELSEQRMVADVRRADFVVVNPEHIAVALRYDKDGEGAPVVVARGERLVAAQIRQVARSTGVPIFRNVSLARALRELAEGDEVPVALYEAVAELLRAVYAMDQAGAPTSVDSPRGDPAPVPALAPALPHGAGWKRV
jgi:flagellar biosynthesis protein FlhB